MTTEQQTQIDEGFSRFIIVVGDIDDLTLKELPGKEAFTMYDSDFVVYRCDTQYSECAYYSICDMTNGCRIGEYYLSSEEAIEEAQKILKKAGEKKYLKASHKKIRVMLKAGIELHKIGKVK